MYKYTSENGKINLCDCKKLQKDDGLLDDRNKWGFKRAAIALMTPFIIGAIMMKFNEMIAVKVGLLSMVIFGLLWFFMYLDSGTKFVHFISRGKYDNPRQLLQNMTHLSYIYGIIISINVEYIIFFIVCVI
mgnify:CR=1 FL=1